MFLNLIDVNFAASLLFVFAVSYALLTKAEIIKERGANVVIALVIGFFAASFPPLVMFLKDILPLAAILLMLAFLAEFLRKLAGDSRDAVPMGVGLFISLVLLAVLWDNVVPYLPSGIDPAQLLWILGIILIALIFYRVYKHTP